MALPPLPELLVADAAAWRAWLTDHHAASPGVWLVLTKKGGDVTALGYEDAVRQALCFGWIDGQGRSRDAATSLQRFTPRRARSRWSALNVRRVGELEQAGLMTPAGAAQVAAAQADGRWDAAYEGPAATTVPDDLAAALAANPDAQAMFDVLTSSNRFAIVYRITSVKRAETRARNIAKYVDMLARGETIYPQKRRP